MTTTMQRKIKPRYRWTILGGGPNELYHDIPFHTEFPPGNNGGVFSAETWYFTQGWEPQEWEWIINVWPTMNPQLLWVGEHIDTPTIGFHLHLFCNGIVWGAMSYVFTRTLVHLVNK